MQAFLKGTKVCIRAKYEDREIVKALGDYKWNKELKAWEFPLRKLPKLTEYLNLTYDKDVADILVEENKRVKERKDLINIANNVKNKSNYATTAYEELKIQEIPVDLYTHLFVHQKQGLTLTALFDAYALFMETGCVDNITEYLSPTGWNQIDCYNKGLVAQYNLDGTAEFVSPSNYLVEPCDEMYCLKHNRGMDQMLSPGHRVLWYDRFNISHVNSIDEIAQIHWKNRTGFRGKFKTTFYLDNKDFLTISDSNLRIQIAVIADGSFTKYNTNRCNIRIKKDRKIKRLKHLLNVAQIPYKEYDAKDNFKVFTFYAPVKTKVFDDRFWGCSYEQRKIICDEVYRWDGGVRKSNALEFYTTIKKNADFIQYCFSSTGHRASINSINRKGHTEYVVHAIGEGKNSNDIWFGRYKDNIQMTRGNFNGFKYSFTVPSSFLIFRRNGQIFVSGNTGKTLVAIRLIQFRKVPTLIVCPLSVIESVWVNELEKWAPDLSYCNLWKHMQKENSIPMIKKGTEYFNVYLINFESFKKIEHPEQHFKFIIIDESSKMKSPKTQITKKFVKLRRLIPYRLIMSGLPAPNDLLEYHSQLAFINDELLGDNYYRFRNIYFRPVGYGGFLYVPKQGVKERIMSKVAEQSFFIRKIDCLDLPDRISEIRNIKLDTSQQQLYDEMKKLNIAEFERHTILAPNELAKIMKLRQLTSGFTITTEGLAIRFSNTKLNVLKEFIEDELPKDQQAIIWVQFHEEVKSITKMLGDQACALYGELKQKEKDHNIKQFQEGKVRFLVAHPKSGGMGLTFINCSYMIWFSLSYSQEEHAQANDRIYRIGQVNKCTYIYMLATNTIDEVIHKALIKKKNMAEACLEMLK